MIFLSSLFKGAKIKTKSILKELINNPEKFILTAVVENNEIHITIKQRK